jgi:hypothetical protein
MKQVPYRSRVLPTVPAGHPDFVWTSGADVQATWMRLTNWRPIYTNQPPKYEEPVREARVTVLAELRKVAK